MFQGPELLSSMKQKGKTMKIFTITLQCLTDNHIFHHDVMAKNDESAYEIAKKYANDDGAMIVSTKELYID